MVVRSVNEARRDEIAANLMAVRARIDRAARSVDRDPQDVTLVAVTKRFDAEDVQILAGLGVRDVAENRHQEAVDKHARVADDRLIWHFIGQLQTNKAAAVAAYADQVDTVDRTSLVRALSKGAVKAHRTVGVLIQVSLAGADGAAAERGGCPVADVAGLAEQIGSAPGLQLRGVMGMAPLGVDPAPAFARLAQAADIVRQIDPAATQVSAGMSGDLEQAVASGATHVRVGTAILGDRPALG